MHCVPVPCSEIMLHNQTTEKQSSDPNSSDPLASLLQESTTRFVADYRNGVNDFSNYCSIFSRLIHSVGDPPVEVVWFYSAMAFHCERPRCERLVSDVKGLFQLLVSYSASSGAAKRIAVLAPVVYELCNLASEAEQLDGVEEVESLLEGMISYFSMCSMEIRDGGDGDRSLSPCFLDVVSALLVDRVVVGDELEAFLPMMSDEARKRLKKLGSGFGGIDCLAGIVLCEAFLLRLCFKFRVESSRVKLEKEARNCAIQMITGFRCFSFFDSLLRMLLEPGLPVAKLLNSKDECLLREVLYDSVVTVDYSFFKLGLELELSSQHLKNLAITWLLVAENIIHFMGKYDNQTKVVAFLRAFSDSYLASLLIKWITDQIGTDGKLIRPNFSTPVELIKWMLHVEEQGIRVFDSEFSSDRANSVVCKSRDRETLFGADFEMVDSVDTSAFDGGQKRKGREDEMIVQAKFVKYQFHESCANERFPSLGCDDRLRRDIADM